MQATLLPVQRPLYMPLFAATEQKQPADLPFIEANTKEVSLSHLQDDCIIPVFSKDNEVTISHQSFIDAILEAAQSAFPQESIGSPSIRVSHVVKGRIPEMDQSSAIGHRD